MSWRAAQWAEKQKTGSPHCKGVLLVLANAAREKPIEGGTGVAYQCHLSHATIADRAECSPDTSQDSLTELERCGLAIRKRRYENGRRTANAIFLNVEGEPAAQFRARVGTPAEVTSREVKHPHKTGEPKPLAAAKAKRPLSRCRWPSKPLAAGDHYIEPGVEPGEREPSLTEKKSPGKISQSWVLPDELREWTRQTFVASDEAITRSAAVFRSHHLRRGTRCTADEWRELWEEWAHREHNFSLKSQNQGTGLMPDEIYRKAVKLFQGGSPWDHKNLGPAPNEPGCRVPPTILAEFIQCQGAGDVRRAG